MALNLTLIFGLLLLVLAVPAGRKILACRREDPAVQRWLFASLPFCAAIFLLLTWVSVARSPQDDWNGARTAPAVAWARGMPLYYPHGVGPATDFIHGPVSAVVRLPAAWASTPTNAILIADAINAAVREIGGSIVPVMGNLADEKDAVAIVDKALSAFGRLDILVNNAGVMDLFESVADVSNETWTRVLGVYLNGPMFTMRRAVPLMLEHYTEP